MKLRSVEEILPETRVILRMDLDLPIENGQILDTSRLIKSLPTIRLLLGKKCKIAVIGHRGRPSGEDANMSLKPVYLELMSMLEPDGVSEVESVFVEEISNPEKLDLSWSQNQLIFLENLRFWKGEENNDSDFLKALIEVAQYYVNDAFAVAHRRAASIMLFKKMPGFYGLSFIEEADKIGRLISDPKKPLTVILGGAKEDKLNYLENLTKIADQVLVGGKLPKIAKDELRVGNEKVIWAKLREDGLDLSDEDINKFREIILQSRTVIWAGAMGRYEDVNCRKGTEEIARAVAAVAGYKIIAGGDTGASIVNLGLRDKIDFICSGGGVMLEYLTKGTLPAWE